jgi:hypothetical protein
MNERLRFILSDIRKIAVEEGVENISLKSINNRLSINSEELMIYIKDEKDLVSKVLEKQFYRHL